MERYRIIPGISVYFFTFRVIEWLPIFISEKPCLILTNSLNFAYENRSLGIYAYVIMPTHFHAILFDRGNDSNRLRETITNLRKFTGRSLSDFCSSELPACFEMVLHSESGNDRERRFWHPTIHAEAVFSQSFLKQKVDYLHHNPVRKGLVAHPQDWRFSSSRFWDGESQNNDVILSDLEFDCIEEEK